MKWFGAGWLDAPITQYAEEAPVPVGAACNHCHRVILLTDIGVFVPHHNEIYAWDDRPYHRECFLNIIGLEIADEVDRQDVDPRLPPEAWVVPEEVEEEPE